MSFFRNIGNDPAVLLYNSLSLREEITRAFVREHICAREFASSINYLKVVSHGVSRCPHSPEGNEGPGKRGPFLCAYGIREAEQNFEDIVLSHDCVITDEPFIVYVRQ